MEEVKGYCSDSCREEEEGAEAIIAITGSSSSRSRLQLQTSQQKEEEEEEEDAAVGNLNRMNEEVDLMELRLGGGGRNSKGISEEGIGIGSCSKDEEEEAVAVEVEVVVEKEHMFDKVVTPSDVGKLNRLVIPKQHAEKYFPLDSSSNEKGLLLNFEDRNGKMWRFRYSYWNSSQSYVMTKGWSRFVKEKKLDAGDIVSFHRGRDELYRHRLYIDWRPRSHHSQAHQYLIPQYHHPPPFYLHPSSSLYSPQYSHLPNPTQYYNTNFYNNNNTTTTTLHQQQQQQYHHPTADHLVNNNNMNNPLYYLSSSPITPPSTATGDHQHLQGLVGQGQQQQQDRRNVNVPMNMIIDSVPVAHHHRGGSIMTPTNSGKRLRLFGVNMECDSSSTPPRVAMPNHPLSPSSTTSVLFDLDPSNSQYHRH